MQNLRKIYKKVFICIVSLVATVSFSNTSYASSNLDQDDEHKVGNSAHVMNIMNANIKKLHADIKDIGDKLTTEIEENSDLQKLLGELQNKFTAETEKISALQKLLGELQNNFTTETEKNSALKKSLDELQNKFTTETERNSALQKSLDELQNKFTAETEKNSALQKLLGELQNSLASLTRRVNNIVTDGLTFNESDFTLPVNGELSDDTTFKANTITEIDLDEV